MCSRDIALLTELNLLMGSCSFCKHPAPHGAGVRVRLHFQYSSIGNSKFYDPGAGCFTVAQVCANRYEVKCSAR